MFRMEKYSGNLLTNHFAIYNRDQLIYTYYQTLCSLNESNRFHRKTLLLSIGIFILNTFRWLFLAIWPLSQWARTVLVDSVNSVGLSPEFNLLMAFGMSQVFIIYHVLYRQCWRNNVSKLPYEVLYGNSPKWHYLHSGPNRVSVSDSSVSFAIRKRYQKLLRILRIWYIIESKFEVS